MIWEKGCTSITSGKSSGQEINKPSQYLWKDPGVEMNSPVSPVFGPFKSFLLTLYAREASLDDQKIHILLSTALESCLKFLWTLMRAKRSIDLHNESAAWHLQS